MCGPDIVLAPFAEGMCSAEIILATFAKGMCSADTVLATFAKGMCSLEIISARLAERMCSREIISAHFAEGMCSREIVSARLDNPMYTAYIAPARLDNPMYSAHIAPARLDNTLRRPPIAPARLDNTLRRPPIAPARLDNTLPRLHITPARLDNTLPRLHITPAPLDDPSAAPYGDTLPGIGYVPRVSVPVVVSTSALPFDITPILGDVTYVAPETGDFSRARLLELVGRADALISLLTFAVDRDLMDAAPGLRVVANFAVGYDNVDVACATERGVAVSNTPDVLTEATADFAFALLLASARRLVEGHELVRGGDWSGWAPGQLLGADVFGRTLGVVGMGRIGRAVARRALGFDMDVIYLTGSGGAGADHASATADDQGQGGSGSASQREPRRARDLYDLLERADFVSLHCPLTDATHHLIDAAALERMKPGAILINTARGPCVDEDALVRALERGTIAGAGLDVFENEPRVHPGLISDVNVVLAPHAGSATTTARRRMAEICARAVRAVLDGRRPETLINPEVYQ